jgi:Subtilase family
VLEFAAARSVKTQGSRFNEAALLALGVTATEELRPACRVAIGFVDYGFDLMHPCLRSAAGDTSRFRFLWDQNLMPAAARTVDLDVSTVGDWNGAALDAAVAKAAASGSRRELDALYDPHANNCGRNGTIGAAHGTLMASMAAGTTFAGFRSAAPHAELIGVQLALLDADWKEEDARGRPAWINASLPADAPWSGWRSYDDAPQIGNAIRYIYDRACKLGVDALVINLSIGAWAGAHDGASRAELAIADLLAKADAAWKAGSGPRTIVVAGAGNAGADDGHWTGVAGASETQTFDWIMQRDDPTQNKLEIWYEANQPLHVELGLPGGSTLRLTPGTTHDITIGTRRVGIADHTFKARGQLSRLRVLAHPPLFPQKAFEAATTAFSFRLRAASGLPVTAHAWIERDDGAAERSWLSPSHPESSLCCLASARGALVIAGYDHHCQPEAGQPAILPASSLGPLPWHAGPSARTPHLTAPATAIWGARSKSRGFAQTTGTSAAVALASGAIAYALACDPNAALPPNDPSAGWSSRFGFGPLSINDAAAVGVSA